MTFPEFRTLRIQKHDDCVVAQLDRPQVRNAIDQIMVDELHELCGIVEKDPQTLVITGCTVETSRGEKAVFASGADIAQLRERRRDDALRGINSTIFQRIAQLPAPVIAAVDGVALGGGLELALAADFRIATPVAIFGQPEAQLGIIAAAGGTYRLKNLVGEAVAKEILLAGRILDGTEAKETHLVNELYSADELVAGAHDLAARIAKQDPLAVRITKRVLDMPEAAHPQVDNLAQAILFESDAKFERMQEFLDRKNKR